MRSCINFFFRISRFVGCSLVDGESFDFDSGSVGINFLRNDEHEKIILQFISCETVSFTSGRFVSLLRQSSETCRQCLRVVQLFYFGASFLN